MAKSQILKPHVVSNRNGQGGIVRENPLITIGVGGAHYIVQGGKVMYEDGTIVENPPHNFWAEYAKVNPVVQEGVNLNANTRQPFGGAVATSQDRASKARAAADEEARKAAQEAAAERDRQAEEARQAAEAAEAKRRAIEEENASAEEKRKAKAAKELQELEDAEADRAKKAAEAAAKASKK